MALAPRLELRQSQQLVMTPQLQQAIKLLQLSNLELAVFVEDQLEQNPFLESGADPSETPSDDSSEGDSNALADTPEGDSSVDLTRADTPQKASDALDTEYTDIDPNASRSDSPDADYKTNEWANIGNGKAHLGGDRDFDATIASEVTLTEHLTKQLHVATRDARQLFVGAYLIDLVDEAGYLRESTTTVAERLGADTTCVEETLEIIQGFDPSGVGARDLKECLSLQLADRNRLDPTMSAFIENIELLAKADLNGLINVTGADEENVRDMIAEVRSLTPKPGYAFGSEPVQIVAPDVFVRKGNDGTWKIELNNETLPKVLVNRRYYAEISGSSNKDEDNVFLNEQFNNANWLSKSLDQRARTILKVSSEIVRQQDAFLVQGVKQLRPLNLRVVADAISMHESTVSRVTSNKYIATPRGLFEMKYFFTASIASSSGGEAHSAESVRCRIRELIDSEAADGVLSDGKIVEILKREGVDIARRTVAKYRETMNIPSSVQRRRLALRDTI